MVVFLATYTEGQSDAVSGSGDLIVYAEGHSGAMSVVMDAINQAYHHDDATSPDDTADDRAADGVVSAQFAMH